MTDPSTGGDAPKQRQRRQSSQQSEQTTSEPQTAQNQEQSAQAGDQSDQPSGLTHEQSAGDERSEQEIQEEHGLAPGPEQPDEVVIFAEDRGTTILPTTVRDPDADFESQFAGSAAQLQERREEEREEREGDREPIEGEQVEFLEAAISAHGVVIVINGNPFAFNKGMAGALKQTVDKAVVGLAL